MNSKWIETIITTIFFPGWISGIFWNMVVGLFGIYFTVLFVDKRAKKREEKRWQPAKDNLHYNLFWLLSEIVHFLNLSEKWQQDTYFHYFWGSYFVTTRYDIKDLNFREVEFTGNSIKGLNTYTVSQLESISRKIDELINHSSQLLEPELLNKLFHFKEKFPSILAILNRYIEVDSDDREGDIDLQSIAEEIFFLFTWLSKRTSRITIDK
jgi:hypothetical protein